MQRFRVWDEEVEGEVRRDDELLTSNLPFEQKIRGYNIWLSSNII
jgi:hypothetical protein